jgi:hypothetical protein
MQVGYLSFLSTLNIERSELPHPFEACRTAYSDEPSSEKPNATAVTAERFLGLTVGGRRQT